MDKEEEKTALDTNLRTSNRRFNVILNKLDLIKRNIEYLDSLEKIEINKDIKSRLIKDLEFYSRRISRMKEGLNRLTDKDSKNNSDKNENEKKVLNDL